jgi:ribosomal-protein-alanine N-acetyltransferase
MTTPPWPVSLTAQDGFPSALALRPLGRGDRREWELVRRDNTEWVGPWEPTAPDGVANHMSFGQYVRWLRREGRSGSTLPFVIEVDGRISGQMHLFGIGRGSLLSGAAGYWVSHRVAGEGVATRALALLCDYALGPAGLHRVEVNIRPENVRSLAVVQHLRFRDEGIRERYLHIEGAWRDHRTFALTREDVTTGSVIQRWSRWSEA